VRVLDKLGAIRLDAVGLALAAGHEPVHYYLSSKVKMMYAGDMYGVGGFAADGTAATSVLEDPAKFVAPGVNWDPARLKLLWQDARNLSYFQDSTIDFVYSLSSIEHFGNDHIAIGHGAAASVWEQARILKPGGIMFMTVDTIVTGQGHNPGNGYTPEQLEHGK
jgi:SAM-dependent methyltransferase